MTKRDVLSIALRILGILGLFWLVVSLPTAVAYIASADSVAINPKLGFNATLFRLLYIFHLMLFLVVSLIFLKYSDQIARRVIRDDSDMSPITTPESGRPIFSLALRIIGAYLLATNLPDLIQYITSWVLSIFDIHVMLIPTTRAAQIVDPAINVALGTYLLLGAEQVARWVYRSGRVELTSKVESNDQT